MTADRFDFDETIASAYAAARMLPAETIELWTGALRDLVPLQTARLVVDLGCGTGRFTTMLADRFAAPVVIGLDLSLPMLAHCRGLGDRRLRAVAGGGEALPLRRASADIVFLSMVYHHFGAVAPVIGELARVLRPDGCVVVRNTTRDALDGFEWMRFFPEVRAIEEARMPTRDALVQAFVSRGFGACGRRTVWQTIARSYEEYFRRIETRAFSSLRLIADEAFRRDLAAFEAYCRATTGPGPVREPVDVFAFQAAGQG